MGIKERQDRDRAAVREAILHAARELFVTEGYRPVSMRRIAERIEYSPAAIYGYFTSKDEIFFALAEEGFRTMQAAARAAAGGQSDPLAAMRAGFWAYYQFSREQPQYFELMFVDRTVPQLTDMERFSVLAEMWHDGVASIARCVEAGIFPATLDVEAAFHILWAATHGAATLHVCQRLGPEENPDLLASDTLDTGHRRLAHGRAHVVCLVALHASGPRSFGRFWSHRSCVAASFCSPRSCWPPA
jgi:AcrR family transcriptional regulator